METMELAMQTETSHLTVPTCPACGAALIPLRGDFRCVRCFLLVCQSCESDSADATELAE